MTYLKRLLTVIGLIASISAITFMQSCDPGVSYSQIIHNNSGYDIWIINSGSTNDGYFYDANFDSVLIIKNTEQIIFTTGGLGQTTEFEDCDVIFDSLTSRVNNFDSFFLDIDLNDKFNWTFHILNHTFKDGGTCECRLIIENEMIN